MLPFEHRSGLRQLKLLRRIPESLRDSTGGGIEWHFSGHRPEPAFCLGCYDQPCLAWAPHEHELEQFSLMSTQASDPVCPVEAISWDNENGVANVNAEACIGCGICVERCPIGAIAINDQGQARVNVCCLEDTALTETRIVSVSEESVAEHRRQMASISAVRMLPILNDSEVSNIYQRVACLAEAQQNRLVRSLLGASGIRTNLSRKGDVHTRNDGAFESTTIVGPLEIEFGQDSLEAIRAALDDLAVFHSRYGCSVSDLSPLVVTLGLPRERQGYWQIVDDVRKVLGVHVHTMSVGALLILVWNHVNVTGDLITECTPRFEHTSIRDQIERAIKRRIQVDVGFLSILEPEK